MSGTHSRKSLKTRYVGAEFFLPKTSTDLYCSFRPSPRSIRPIYTGGPVLLTKDGQWIITTMGEEALVTEVQTGLAIARIRGASFIAFLFTLSDPMY